MTFSLNQHHSINNKEETKRTTNNQPGGLTQALESKGHVFKYTDGRLESDPEPGTPLLHLTPPPPQLITLNQNHGIKKLKASATAPSTATTNATFPQATSSPAQSTTQ